MSQVELELDTEFEWLMDDSVITVVVTVEEEVVAQWEEYQAELARIEEERLAEEARIVVEQEAQAQREREATAQTPSGGGNGGGNAPASEGNNSAPAPASSNPSANDAPSSPAPVENNSPVDMSNVDESGANCNNAVPGWAWWSWGPNAPRVCMFQ